MVATPAIPTAPAQLKPTEAEAPEPQQTQQQTPQPTTPNTPLPQPTVRRPLISGASISELLASAGELDEESAEGDAADEPESLSIDPECAEKLERLRPQILHLIQEKRPRFVAAFELMSFHDNTIHVEVPTTELREEILRNKTAMLMRIVEIAGIEGCIELQVEVCEQIRAIRPIKLEDRVKYITERNPLVAELRKALDLEVE